MWSSYVELLIFKDMTVRTLHSLSELRVEMIVRKRKRIPQLILAQRRAKLATEPVSDDESIDIRLRQKRLEAAREGVSLIKKTISPAVEIMGTLRIISESEAEDLRSAGWTIIYIEV